MEVEKFTSNKAAIECRFNEVQHRWRCHVAIGQKRVGPLFVRVPEGIEAAEAPAEAARLALTRAIARRAINAADIEQEDGVPVVHVEAAKRKAPPAKVKAPAAKVAAPTASKAPAAPEKPAPAKAAKGKRPASPMGEAAALELVGNGEETRALEDLYEEVKDEYHGVGEALRERHLAVAAVAEQPE